MESAMSSDDRFPDTCARGDDDSIISSEPNIRPGKVYLVGGGIASMAAAAFLIRDGDVRGCDITIIESRITLGGSLDGAGSATTGYVLRGGRMLESKYLCTFDLFGSIPTLDGDKTVTDEILDWNKTLQTSAKSRLVRGGVALTAPKFGLSEGDIATLSRLLVEPEGMLGNTSIADQFRPTFFHTDFWFMWCTTFAFQPWHSAVEFKRYIVRFVHMVDGFSRLRGILRTVYNQYDSMVRPLEKWLRDHGVVFHLDTSVTDLDLVEQDQVTAVGQIRYLRNGVTGMFQIDHDDLVMVTLGSMTEGSTLGDMEHSPQIAPFVQDESWALWRKVAAGRNDFGRPSVFANHIEQSKWVSFTVTLNDFALLHRIRDMTGNVPGEGGLMTFPESNWLASIVIPHQPHFLGQPDGVAVFWGYGLSVDSLGNSVGKPMSECSGREILKEILYHLGFKIEMGAVLDAAICIPCMMPYITSQFLSREHGDRPEVVPLGTRNLAFIGQFCELPEDVVFTVEYSIRSAQTAVYQLLDLQRAPPPVYHGAFDPSVLFKAFVALHDL